MSMEGNTMMPIISKMYCSSSQALLVVRRRPHVVNGGGFVVTDHCTHKIVFRVDGCGVLGVKGELIVRDAKGDPLVLIRRQKGMLQALSIYKKWKGYAFDYEGSHKLVFSIKEPPLLSNNAIRISTETPAAGGSSSKSCNYEIKGYFPDRDCSIFDSKGNVVAQIGVKKEVEDLMDSKDLYHIVVKPGIDKAFVVGVIGTLDYIYGESTTC